MRVTGVHNNSLDRQVTEDVNIASFGGEFLMNRRGELGGVRIERQQYRRWGDLNVFDQLQLSTWSMNFVDFLPVANKMRTLYVF